MRKVTTGVRCAPLVKMESNNERKFFIFILIRQFVLINEQYVQCTQTINNISSANYHKDNCQGITVLGIRNNRISRTR
jgi:hypothetical protein